MKPNYTCIIIDDEDYAVESLSQSLKLLYSNINIIGSYTSWKDGLEALRKQKSDILFLDISIGGKNGMDLLKLVPGTESEVIFITAYSEYALEAFNYSATGYIVKPIGELELSKAVDKAIERIDHKRLSNLNLSTSTVSKIGIPGNQGIDYIDIDEILYFESVSGYTKVITINAEILSSYRIGKYKSLLEDQPFYQVHRSYIVNINHIRRYNTTGEIVMTNNKVIPTAKNLRDDLLQLFNTVSNRTNSRE